jgi:hypothetical protein
MNGFRHLMLRTTSDRIRSLVLCVALSACVVGHFDPAVAQTPPPLVPPVVSPLPSGSGSLSLGQWLLTPTLGLYGLYDTNIHSNVTAPLSGPGFHIHPSLLADFNTGIFDTSLYGNIDSVIYPTLDPLNDTFNRQAGFIQKYSPLPDLIFSAQGDYKRQCHSKLDHAISFLEFHPDHFAGVSSTSGCRRSYGKPTNCGRSQRHLYRHVQRIQRIQSRFYKAWRLDCRNKL